MSVPAETVTESAEHALRVSRSIAAEVRAAMARKKVRQAPLALALDMSQSALSRRLNGEHPFDVAELDRVAAYLGVTLDELVVNRSSRWIFDSVDLHTVETVGQVELPFPVDRSFAVVS